MTSAWPSFCHADVGLELVVFLQEDDVLPAQLAAVFFQRQVEAVDHVLAQRRAGTGQRREKADLDLGQGRPRGQAHREGQSGHQQCFAKRHVCLLKDLII
jgi:hypothetical protein